MQSFSSRVGLGWIGLLGLGVALNCVGGDDNISPPDASGDTSIPDTSTPDTKVDDGSTDSNACSSAPTTTFYVNAATGNDTTNNGAGATCAFKTITAALKASNDDSFSNATINIAAGTYATNETFPLIVNHGRSLVGAGASSTKIQGSAAYGTINTDSLFDTPDGGASKYFVTIVAGDVLGGSNSLTAGNIANLTILPPTAIAAPTPNYIGVACITGNGPNTNTTPPLPPPNLIIKGTTIGPNFDTALFIASSPTSQTACNVSAITSTFTGSNVGIVTGGCGGATNPNLSWPSAQIGDGQVADANSFTATGIGVFGEGCGSVQSINTNHFVSGYRGIVLVTQPAQYIEILGNTFDGTASPGMALGVNTNQSAVIAKMNDNTFTNISESPAADTAIGATTGYAIALGGGYVTQAQRNTIANNDNGISIVGTLGTTFDFSDDGSAVNRNLFYCNSKISSGNGYDVILNYTGGGSANFQGNQWDHFVPSMGASISTSANGTDIVGPDSVNAGSPGATITTACATGRIH